MRHAVRERGVEDDLEPARHMRLSVDHLKAGWRVHPGVEGQDPKRRSGGAQGYEPCGQGVHPFADAASAKQHDAQKGGF